MRRTTAALGAALVLLGGLGSSAAGAVGGGDALGAGPCALEPLTVVRT